MREIALEVMKRLEKYDPILIGSVWRGTPRMGSDIDIIVYGNPDKIILLLDDYQMKDYETQEFNIRGLPRISSHLYLIIGKYPIEIVIRPPRDREIYTNERCETYGDIKRGIRLSDLEKLIQTDPLRRFIPKRRST
jgi:predicted nucleotidyltransferase